MKLLEEAQVARALGAPVRETRSICETLLVASAGTSTSRVPVDATLERGVLEVKPWRSSEPDATGEGVVVIEERDDGQVRGVAHVVGESVGGSKIGLPAVRRCVSGTLEPMLLSAIREA